MARTAKPKLSAEIRPEWVEDIDALMETINQNYGAGTVVLGSQTTTRRRYFSTGSTALDIALCGGFAENYITEIRGPFSAGKTTLLLLGICAFQRKYKHGLAAIVDAERSWDRIYAERLGVDLDRIHIVNPDSGEQGANVIRDLMDCNQETLIGIDSIAAMTPSQEITDPIEKANMALQARLINRAMRIITARMKRSAYDTSAPSITVLALNQLRQKVGVMFGNPETTPGGEGQNFYYGVRIRVASNAGGEVRETVKKAGMERTMRIQQTISFKVSKNKAGGPQNEEGEAIWQVRDPKTKDLVLKFDNVTPLLEHGVFHDIVEVVDGKDFAYGDFQASKKGFLRALSEDLEMRRMLKKAIIQKLWDEWLIEKRGSK